MKKEWGSCVGWERFVDFAENKETFPLNIRHWLADCQHLLVAPTVHVLQYKSTRNAYTGTGR